MSAAALQRKLEKRAHKAVKAILRHDLVLIETMPEYLWASHEAANNWGVYPHNGAERLLVPRRGSEDLLSDNGYDHIVRGAKPRDLENYQIMIAGLRHGMG